jgi:hypothetical protein
MSVVTMQATFSHSSVGRKSGGHCKPTTFRSLHRECRGSRQRLKQRSSSLSQSRSPPTTRPGSTSRLALLTSATSMIRRTVGPRALAKPIGADLPVASIALTLPPGSDALQADGEGRSVSADSARSPGWCSCPLRTVWSNPLSPTRLTCIDDHPRVLAACVGRWRHRAAYCRPTLANRAVGTTVRGGRLRGFPHVVEIAFEVSRRRRGSRQSVARRRSE